MERSILAVEPLREGWVIRLRGKALDIRATKLEAIGAAEAVVICCSNPVTSIGPILAVPGILDALACTPAPVVAVSPIIGGQAVSGPAAKLLSARGLDVSPLGVARAYRPWLDVLVVDRVDRAHGPILERGGVRATRK